MDREEFEALSPEEQARIFAETPLAERTELILLAHEPDRLTRALSGEELYLMIRDLDMDEKAEILRLAGNEQLSFLADMDCWKRDQIDPSQFVRWLGTLLAADEAVALRWMHFSDYETIIAGFQKFARVIKPEWETVVDDIVGDQPYFTLDRMYYILVSDEDLETVKRVIEVLYENDRPRYFTLLEGVLSEMEYEMEEEAYRRRERRLADRGFPDMETAMRALMPLDQKGFDEFPRKESFQDTEESGQDPVVRLPAPRYPVLWSMTRRFLDDVLLSLDEESEPVREGIYEQLAWLSNKMVVCSGMDFTSEEKVRSAVDRVRALVSLGLELLSEGDLDKAAAILKDRWIESVFRFALGELYPLRDRTRALIKTDWKGEGEIFFTFLEQPYEFILRGLSEKMPLCYDESVTDSLYHHREFSNRQDVSRARRALEQIECLHRFIKRRSPSVFMRILRESGLGGAEETLTALCGTLFVRYGLDLKLNFDRLSLSQVGKFLDEAFEEKGAGRYLRPELREKFMADLLDPEDSELLMPFWGLVFQKIQEQMSRLKLDKSVEGKLLTCILVELETPDFQEEEPAKPLASKAAPRKAKRKS